MQLGATLHVQHNYILRRLPSAHLPAIAKQLIFGAHRREERFSLLLYPIYGRSLTCRPLISISLVGITVLNFPQSGAAVLLAPSSEVVAYEGSVRAADG